MRKLLISGLLALIATFSVGGFAFASATNGTIDTTNKYAWGENIGWINFGCDNCNVAITDAGITGYAWSTQYGWINLNPTQSGVDNNGEGTLSGYAWGSNLGWINFTGVTIDTSGVFSGYATLDSDSSRINFNCATGDSCASADFKVKTDWRPSSSRTSASSGGSSGSRPRLPTILPTIIPTVTSPITIVPPVKLTANIFNSISDFVIGLFKPTALVEVPKIAPPTLSARWNLLPERAINIFVFSPLPYEIRILASKFPELDRTFKEVGIERFTDVNKLAGVELKIPGLTNVLNTSIKNITPNELAELEKIEGVRISMPGFSDIPGSLPSSVGTGKIALIEGLPVANFSAGTKRDLPGEFVFARGAGELVDLSVALSVSEMGEVSQRVSALPGKTLKLVVKPIGPARSVSGYIVFKAATPRVSENSILRSSLTASALFSMNDFVEKIPTPPPASPEGGGENSKALSFGEGAGGVEKKLVLSSFEYEDPDRDGIYTADVAMPVVPGEYEVITIIDYIDPELGARKISMITVIDPEGYVYEENGGKETRIPNAVVSLYRLNMSTKEYEPWNAGDYQQENPQITDIRGTYSFLVPAGTYHFLVEAPGYRTFEGKAFVVAEGKGVHQNIELKSSMIRLAGVDWQTVLLIVVLLLLVYNLYRNKHGTQ